MSTEELEKNDWKVVEHDEGHKTFSVEHKKIDWISTGFNLENLRHRNPNLQQYVCSQLKYKDCDGGICTECDVRYMDRSISRPELGDVIGVSENVICNWEAGTTRVDLEDLLFYCAIAKVKLEDIIEFEAPETEQQGHDTSDVEA